MVIISINIKIINVYRVNVYYFYFLFNYSYLTVVYKLNQKYDIIVVDSSIKNSRRKSIIYNVQYVFDF